MNKYPYKFTPTEYDLDDLIKKRWSPVAFSAQPIEMEKINSLFEAMRWAPSSRNEQPWRIVYATRDNEQEFNVLADLLDEGNSYAKDAFLLLVICGLRHHNYHHKPNRTYQYDTGAGAQNLFLQAVSLDLVAHEMGGFDIKRSYEVLGIPKEEVEVIAMIAVGHPGDESKLSPQFQAKQSEPRNRQPISDFVFKGRWR
ncbi:MAG: nitroreductase family protein [Patescibacteria group bacterium]|jgi:nitroreductase|nr:nitroreductase family protein [Patescibacteria group bacterium]